MGKNRGNGKDGKTWKAKEAQEEENEEERVLLTHSTVRRAGSGYGNSLELRL